jgi:hypothetical protein
MQTKTFSPILSARWRKRGAWQSVKAWLAFIHCWLAFDCASKLTAPEWDVLFGHWPPLLLRQIPLDGH